LLASVAMMVYVPAGLLLDGLVAGVPLIVYVNDPEPPVALNTIDPVFEPKQPGWIVPTVEILICGFVEVNVMMELVVQLFTSVATMV
jgi:hypothetical protein